MAKRLVDQRDELLRDLDRDLRYVNDAVAVGNDKEARRFAVTLHADAVELLTILTKIEKKSEKTRG
jgi:hypothetical protein